MDPNPSIILPCKNCKAKTTTKKFDIFGKEIKEVICWNCINEEITKIGMDKAVKFIKDSKNKVKKLIKIDEDPRRNKKIKHWVLKDIPNIFNRQDIYDSYLKFKKKFKIASPIITENKKFKAQTTQHFLNRWVKQKYIEKVSGSPVLTYEKKIFRKKSPKKPK